MERWKKILDASVIFKWFSKETDSDKAIKLKDERLARESTLIIPNFAIIELINALKYKEKDANKLKEANKSLKQLQLKIKDVTKLI